MRGLLRDLEWRMNASRNDQDTPCVRSAVRAPEVRGNQARMWALGESPRSLRPKPTTPKAAELTGRLREVSGCATQSSS
jgi:hypothetical protein